MEKSNLGIAKELLAAGIFVGALAGGYVFAGLMVLYVLLKEDDQWLKEMAVKAIATLMVFSFFINAINLLPTVVRWFGDLTSILDAGWDSYKLVTGLGLITNAIDIVRIIFFLVLAVKALKHQTINVPIVDDLIKKYL
ncbi:hypothetical protein SAMN04487829_2707 [Pseudobutyrivibrio sp. NOR37]|uniref:Uncharacterized protein n=2 Tax=Pseudobutyrivibrio TaxID=46205 RepID=A0A2G3EC92_9FIRM|nr:MULTISPECIES: hypothetical protein [Pseudobutyrivibrio]NEX02887.1 hypothetical protein [Pseudobutyrivibrio xylanivorans]PHU40733.1 hypothetical protein CSX00_04435 [Pseudobutyrivibrio ruminis]SFR86226.1 hypothetical protein SAMN04487829_2707 [Pseudobutyrivibrio sp. NOR37]